MLSFVACIGSLDVRGGGNYIGIDFQSIAKKILAKTSIRLPFPEGLILP